MLKYFSESSFPVKGFAGPSSARVASFTVVLCRVKLSRIDSDFFEAYGVDDMNGVASAWFMCARYGLLAGSRLAIPFVFAFLAGRSFSTRSPDIVPGIGMV